MSRIFREALDVGRVGESLISRWLQKRGCVVVPAYEIEINQGKGPRVFLSTGQLVAPDLLCIKPGESITWIEAKHKTVFSWYRKRQRWETGIDHRHWLDYCKVEEKTKLPVWLMFLHRESEPWKGDRPYLPSGVDRCPVGLFGISLKSAKETFRFAPQHASGMVYWPHTKLQKLATLSEVA